MALLPYR